MRTDVADDEPTEPIDAPQLPDAEPATAVDGEATTSMDTAALLDQGEQLLAQSARLLRRLDDALGRGNTPPDGTPTVESR